MNRCLKEKRIPEGWKKARVSLLPKAPEDQHMAGGYRPISLLNVQYKIYTAILLHRLEKFLQAHKVMATGQHGFTRGKATIEHISTLISCYEDRKQHNKKLLAMYIDFAKAYDSVEHWLIEKTMKYYGVGNNFTEAVMALYKGAKAKLSTPFGDSEEFVVTRGVRQGDVLLSPILFNITINPLIKWIEKSGKGYTFHKNHAISTKILAWCDDFVIFTEKAEDMTEAMRQVAMFCKYSGMEVNVKKTLLQSSEPDRVKIPYMEGFIEESENTHERLN